MINIRDGAAAIPSIGRFTGPHDCDLSQLTLCYRITPQCGVFLPIPPLRRTGWPTLQGKHLAPRLSSLPSTTPPRSAPGAPWLGAATMSEGWIGVAPRRGRPFCLLGLGQAASP